jgi:hypothetical protein
MTFHTDFSEEKPKLDSVSLTKIDLSFFLPRDLI